jgi:ABC-type glycerol-3-phosphate transport system permease component
MTEVDRLPSRRQSDRRRKILIYGFMTLLVILYSLPLLGVLLTSLKTTEEIAREGLWNLPDFLNWSNFSQAWLQGNGRVYMINSFLVTIPATIGSIACGVLTGYVFSKLPFRGSNLLFMLIIAGMFFPPQIVLIPLFRFFNAIGLYDTLWPMIIVHIAFGIPICTLVLRNFFSAIPNAIRESAVIDGANEFQVLTRIILPISMPALAVLATSGRFLCASCSLSACRLSPCSPRSSSPGSGTTFCGRSFLPNRTAGGPLWSVWYRSKASIAWRMGYKVRWL